MAVIRISNVIPIVDLAEIVFDYFNETKNNYRLVVEQYHSLFSWDDSVTTFGPGNLLRKTQVNYFLYNYRSHSFKNHNELQWSYERSDLSFSRTTIGIWNFTTGFVTLLPRSYYYRDSLIN